MKKSSGPIIGRNSVPINQTSLSVLFSLFVTSIIIQEIRNRGTPEKITICQNIKPTSGVTVSIGFEIKFIV